MTIGKIDLKTVLADGERLKRNGTDPDGETTAALATALVTSGAVKDALDTKATAADLGTAAAMTPTEVVEDAGAQASLADTYAPHLRQLTIPAWLTPAATSGTWTVAISSLRPLGVWNLSAGVQNQEIAWDVALSAGTWTFDLVHEANINRGIYTVALADIAANGTVGSFADVGTVDGYAASATATKSSITGITVASPGAKRVRLKMATKNASSSSYFGNPSALGFVRTA